MPPLATDINGDRAPDIVVSGTRREQSDPPGGHGRARLLINDGRGRFAVDSIAVEGMWCSRAVDGVG